MSSTPVQTSTNNRDMQILAAEKFMSDIKAAMRRAVKASGHSRDHIVDAINDIIRHGDVKGVCKGSEYLSLSTFEKWLADEERGQLPSLMGLHLLMLVTSRDPLEKWVALYDCIVVDAKARLKLEIMELEIAMAANEKRQKELWRKLMEEE